MFPLQVLIAGLDVMKVTIGLRFPSNATRFGHGGECAIYTELFEGIHLEMRAHWTVVQAQL